MYADTTCTRALSRLTLLCLFVWFAIFNLGCASSEKSRPKEWQQTVTLRGNQSAWMRVDAEFAKIIIINEGPTNLTVRIPAVGTPVFDEVILKPRQSYRDLFFDTRSIAFTNNDPRKTNIFHFQIKGDPMTIQFHQGQSPSTQTK